jgi:hypothetical protein
MSREKADQNHDGRDDQQNVDESTCDPKEQSATPKEDKDCGNDEQHTGLLLWHWISPFF